MLIFKQGNAVVGLHFRKVSPGSLRWTDPFWTSFQDKLGTPHSPQHPGLTPAQHQLVGIVILANLSSSQILSTESSTRVKVLRLGSL